MLQVSLLGYAVSGAFLGLAYFDLYYNLIALIVLAKTLAQKSLNKEKSLDRSKEDSVEMIPSFVVRKN